MGIAKESGEWEWAAGTAISDYRSDQAALRVNGMFYDPVPPSKMHLWHNGSLRRLLLWRAVRDIEVDSDGRLEVSAIYYVDP